MESKTLKEVYQNGSEELQNILKERFSKQELGIEVNKEEFNQFFIDILEKYKNNVMFMGFGNYQIFDENGEWLLVN